MTVLSLFCREEFQPTDFPSRALTRGWFFDICIQGRKIQLLELSLKREFQLSHFRDCAERRGRNRLIKLLRAHDGCLGANRR